MHLKTQHFFQYLGWSSKGQHFQYLGLFEMPMQLFLWNSQLLGLLRAKEGSFIGTSSTFRVSIHERSDGSFWYFFNI